MGMYEISVDTMVSVFKLTEAAINVIALSPRSHCERGHNNLYLKDPVRSSGVRTQDARMTDVAVRRTTNAPGHLLYYVIHEPKMT